jgi:hypothetical protein
MMNENGNATVRTDMVAWGHHVGHEGGRVLDFIVEVVENALLWRQHGCEAQDEQIKEMVRRIRR